MNLDLDTLREMISNTLVELSNPEAGNTVPEEELAASAKEVAAKAEVVAAEAGEEEAAEKAEEDRQNKLSPTPPQPTMESFEITKGRLRQIIAEELISAKKQGIL